MSFVERLIISCRHLEVSTIGGSTEFFQGYCIAACLIQAIRFQLLPATMLYVSVEFNTLAKY